MMLILNDRTDAYFNLALEEYLLTHFDDNCIALWRNGPSVIVGKNQNTLEEINRAFVEEHDIRVVRRLTGGGAVFHDEGNINFTYIEACGAGRFNDYAHFTRDIIGFLKTFGVEAALSGRNDLTVDGKKFSGNAQCIRCGKILHHGTLLFSADLTDLVGALNANPLKMESKGIKSVSSRVANLADHLGVKMDAVEFKSRLEQYLLSVYDDLHAHELTPEDIAAVEALVREKYGTWAWNFGASPEYNYKNAARFEGGIVEVRLRVAGGVIRSADISGDFFGARDIGEVVKALVGVRHEHEQIESALEGFDLGEYLSGVTRAEFIGLLQ
ncbi:MAG: lipoate--protein ligase [Clostridia bacterium]|nr:lipoate--protein ligase [Clostridia bacterium]